jgi:prepilin-type processing-associated H-X9-DG protein
MPNRANWSGITLIEVVVVIAIIALIAALLLPAILRSHGAVSRLECGNRLRQIGLALQHYSSDWGCFPPPAIASPGEFFAAPGPWGTHVCLLPYLEQSNVYNSLNRGVFWQDVANTTVESMSLSVFLCPSDSILRGSKYGFGNFVACMGSGLYPLGFDAEIDPSALYDGLFFGMDGIKPSECADGLSQTAAFSEIIHGGSLIGTFKPPDIPTPPTPGLEYSFAPFSPATQRKLIEMCSNLGPDYPRLSADPAGAMWFLGLTYNHLLTPNNPRCIGASFGDAWSAMTASSRHPGMVHVVFADGHVSAISDSIDLDTWRALGSRNRAEVIDRSF